MADAVAQQLLNSFSRMVRGDGGQVEILDDAADIVIGYRPGGPPPDCETGACVLPHVELQDMMREWMARRSPGRQVSVRLLQPGA
jgi:hypothetical protein